MRMALFILCMKVSLYYFYIQSWGLLVWFRNQVTILVS